VSDTVAIEAKGRVHARVMEREHEAQVSCDGASGVLERLQCIFKSSVTRCSWVEIDSPALAAQPMGSDLQACRDLPGRGPRVALDRPTPVTGWRLDADPKEERVAVGSGSEAVVLYLLDGTVVGSTSAAWPVSWSGVDRLDAHLEDFFSSSPEGATSERLLEYALRTQGEATLVRMIDRVVETSIDRWHDGYQRLEDPNNKREALKLLHARLRGDVSVIELLAGLVAYPDAQPSNFERLLAAAASDSVVQGVDWYTMQPLLAELARRQNPLADRLACRIYGEQVIGALPGTEDMYSQAADTSKRDDALEFLARSKVPCPWVAIALDANPCSPLLRCALDGGAPNDEEAVAGGDGVDPVSVRPLCSRDVADRMLDLPQYGPEGAAGDPYSGVALLAAGYARGALSRELVLRNARRLYRYQYPPAPSPSSDDEEPVSDALMPLCRQPGNLPDAVCQLPLTVTDLEYGGCRLHIDDKAKVVRVEEVEAK
jgi:hypothetical protein